MSKAPEVYQRETHVGTAWTFDGAPGGMFWTSKAEAERHASKQAPAEQEPKNVSDARTLTGMGDELHNLSCEIHHTNEEWADQIQGIGMELWNWQARQQAPAEHAEPVAWRQFDGEGNYDYTDCEETAEVWKSRNGPRRADWIQPLYAAPVDQSELEKDPFGAKLKRITSRLENMVALTERLLSAEEDAERFRFACKHGWPECLRQIHPTEEPPTWGYGSERRFNSPAEAIDDARAALAKHGGDKA